MSATSSWQKALGQKIQPGEVLAGKYRLDRIVATGGMGVIVQAHHLALDETVAIKFLNPGEGLKEESLVRFEREARASFKLQGEHACRVYDVGRHDELPYMVMEYLEGQDLGYLLEDQIPHATADAVDFILQATEAVAEAHAHGIVHRDLKPENIFLARRPDGRTSIKVLDFGLSKLHDGAGGRERAVTRTQQIMGTPEYMSPEQWMSARDVGPTSDQWSLGVILYELLTGRQPFHEDNFARLCARVLRGEIEPIRTYRGDVPVALEAAVLRALTKDPEGRFPHLGAFARAIAPFGHQREAQASSRRIDRLLNVTTDLSLEVAAQLAPSGSAPDRPSRAYGSAEHEPRGGETRLAPDKTERFPRGDRGFDPREEAKTQERVPRSGTHARRRLAELKTTDVMDRSALQAEMEKHRPPAEPALGGADRGSRPSGAGESPPRSNPHASGSNPSGFDPRLSSGVHPQPPLPDAPTVPLRRPPAPGGPTTGAWVGANLVVIVLTAIVTLGLFATLVAIAVL